MEQGVDHSKERLRFLETRKRGVTTGLQAPGSPGLDMEWSEALEWLSLCRSVQWPKSTDTDTSHPQHSEQKSGTDISQPVSRIA